LLNKHQKQLTKKRFPLVNKKLFKEQLQAHGIVQILQFFDYGLIALLQVKIKLLQRYCYRLGSGSNGLYTETTLLKTLRQLDRRLVAQGQNK
jgi:hypothetical protein